ncbi:MAG TPA: hypothetical protein VGE06_11595, partial [Flavisolibacter sp.]
IPPLATCEKKIDRDHLLKQPVTVVCQSLPAFFIFIHCKALAERIVEKGRHDKPLSNGNVYLGCLSVAACITKTFH